MKNIIDNYRLIFLLILILSPSLPAQERYLYYSFPDTSLSGKNKPGIADTIIFPENIIIEDINFYVGVYANSLGKDLGIKVISPWRDTVVVHNHNPQRPLLECWFDTDYEEDGPGNLNDYIGFNACGLWVMQFDEYSGDSLISWDSWILEIIGEPLTDEGVPIPLASGLNEISINPYNSTAVIHYSLAGKGSAEFQIYDVDGTVIGTYAYDSL